MTWAPMHVWATPSYADPTMFVSFRPHPSYLPPTDRQYTLELLSIPASVTGAPPVGTTWILPVDEDATFTIELPTYRAENGNGAYQLAFTFGAANMPGDMDGDQDVDFDDIAPFVLGLSDPTAYETQYGVPPSSRGDTDTDGDLDFDDIPAFVTAVRSGSGLCAVPEPGSLVLTGLAFLVLAFFGTRPRR